MKSETIETPNMKLTAHYQTKMSLALRETRKMCLAEPEDFHIVGSLEDPFFVWFPDEKAESLATLDEFIQIAEELEKVGLN